MKGFARRKVPGGKMLSIKVQYGKVITKVEILGDFFMYPDDALSDIEHSLVNMKASESEEKLAKAISKVADAQKVQMIGITPKEIAGTVKEAMKK